MHAAHTAALHVFRESYDLLQHTLRGLSDEALNGNRGGEPSIAALTVQALVNADFWVGNATGAVMGTDAYGLQSNIPDLEQGRIPAEELMVWVDFMHERICDALRAAQPEHLEVEVPRPEGGDPRSGVEALMHAMAQLREQIGQMEALRGRDLRVK